MSPSLVSVVNHNTNSVTVTWNPIDNATRYAGQYSVAGESNWIHFESLRQNKRLYTLLAGTEYDIQFKVQINGIWQEWSETFNFTTLS